MLQLEGTSCTASTIATHDSRVRLTEWNTNNRSAPCESAWLIETKDFNLDIPTCKNNLALPSKILQQESNSLRTYWAQNSPIIFLLSDVPLWEIVGTICRRSLLDSLNIWGWGNKSKAHLCSSTCQAATLIRGHGNDSTWIWKSGCSLQEKSWLGRGWACRLSTYWPSESSPGDQWNPKSTGKGQKADVYGKTKALLRHDEGLRPGSRSILEHIQFRCICLGKSRSIFKLL